MKFILKKREDVFYANVAGSYRVNRKKTAHEFKLEFTNLTNNKTKVTEYYNNNNRKIEVGYQLPMLTKIMCILISRIFLHKIYCSRFR
jgi:hypothetical protein